jgi:hypothetical protein
MIEINIISGIAIGGREHPDRIYYVIPSEKVNSSWFSVINLERHLLHNGYYTIMIGKTPKETSWK